MIKRAVVIFPKCNNIKSINDIRDKYDPLANLIFPHITLVFPFVSDDTEKEIYHFPVNLHLKSSFVEYQKTLILMEIIYF